MSETTEKWNEMSASNDSMTIDLRFEPYFEVQKGSKIELFINGVSRGVVFSLEDAHVYLIPYYPKYGKEQLFF